LKILIELGIKSTNVYKKEFEDQFLIKTKEYYKQEARKCILNSSCTEYLKLVARRIKEEETRCLSYLIEQTKLPLI